MSDRLLPLLLLLTLLDLGFVHATEVVDGLSLSPLWLLGAGAPWLRRWQRFRLYRFAWNGGVLLVFTLLVHHATTTGLLHMLEDGLVLAVLCQVHLLNNVGEKQRPDLIFFNSFLIAFVTSFFAPDLAWCALFVLHSFTLVPALQTYCLQRGGRPMTPALLRAARRGSVRRTLVIGIATALAFVVLPRDFRRQGWLGDALALRQQFEAGLAERIEIGDEREARLGTDLVATITPASGRADDVPSHWRATAFSQFDGSAWSPQDARHLQSRFATDAPWEQHSDGSMRRPAAADGGPRLAVQLHDMTSARLLLPLAATNVHPRSDAPLLLDARSDGGLRLLTEGSSPVRQLAFTVVTGGVRPTAPPTARVLAHMTNLPPQGVPTVVSDLAARLRAELPPGADAFTVATACSDWLQQNRRYQLPGESGFARNLGEFLLGSGAGHCEYFATALALLLRVQEVPCRLVGGYLAHEWDATNGRMLVRGRDAHAWVEVLTRDGRWHTVDATPPRELSGPANAATTWWSQLQEALLAAWRAITDFDQASRDRWLAGLRSLLAGPWFHLGAAMATAAIVVYVRRRRRQTLPAIVTLHRAMRAAGLSLRSGETPRELVLRATALTLEPPVLARLRTAALAHELARYGQDPATERR